MKKMEKKLYVMLLFIFTLTLAIAFSYAAFRPTLTRTGNNDELIIMSGDWGNEPIELECTDCGDFEYSHIIPGWSETRTFIIHNRGNNPVEYDFLMGNTANNLTFGINFSISGTNGGTTFNAQVPLTGSTISFGAGTLIPGNASQTYTLIVSYPSLGINQNIDMGKSFDFTLEIRPA